ncbi:substrate-binding domain-containing protein [Sulfuritalea sp.]|uniref:substrate-binding domain-containing protein n=1 Tax=Sulfuritalea sp. TaxID=2480090 RepID=UPI00286E6843|nr:substrate-binding domain-containing protein [Sulfuritalea sp.]
MQTPKITGISSMATRQVLAKLAAAYRQSGGVEVSIESVGGVDAARRVQAGEVFDFVVLAADAIAKLIASGQVLADSRTDLVRSTVAIAVRAGSARPDVGSEDALRRAVLAARTLGYSTGPSGTELLQLFARWGIADMVRDRIVQAPPGVPVGQLVADGAVELGFQQFSEMLHQPGIEVLGTMPAGCEIVTTFSGGVCTATKQAVAARTLLAFMHSPAAADAKRRHGMEPA